MGGKITNEYKTFLLDPNYHVAKDEHGHEGYGRTEEAAQHSLEEAQELNCTFVSDSITYGPDDPDAYSTDPLYFKRGRSYDTSSEEESDEGEQVVESQHFDYDDAEDETQYSSPALTPTGGTGTTNKGFTNFITLVGLVLFSLFLIGEMITGLSATRQQFAPVWYKYPSPNPPAIYVGDTTNGDMVYEWGGMRQVIPDMNMPYQYVCVIGNTLRTCWPRPPHPTAVPCRPNAYRAPGWCWKE